MAWQTIEEQVSERLVRFVRSVARHAGATLAGVALLTVLAGTVAFTSLRINSDNVRLLSEEVRRNHVAFAELFPNLENALLVVIDAETPELARDAADRLAERLRAKPELFTDVYLPGGSDFFERNGLLYRDLDELELFADQLAAVQPIIAELERDSSVANFAALVKRGLEEAEGGDDERWDSVLRSVGRATVEVYSEFPLAISWEELLLRDSAMDQARRRVLVVHPVLDFEDVLAARRPLAVIHDAAGSLSLTPDRGVTVRVTGNPALNYEEMIGLAWDIGLGGAVTFFLVAGLLLLALRSPALVVTSLVTLLTGLVWTAALATVTVGHLSVISLAFGVLFIGLGVDFAIHLGMRYAHQRREGDDHERALEVAAGTVGSSLVLCTVTTMTGFFVFVPTEYVGVAELGLIAGSGMFVVVLLTFSLWPALLTKGCRMRTPPRRSLHFQAGAGGAGPSGRLVRALALAAGVAGLVLAPRVGFEANIIEMRDPGTPSVQAFNDLLAQSGTASPWFANVVTEDLETAVALARRYEELPEVEQALTLASYVPEDQEAKLEILDELAFLMQPTGAVGSGGPGLSTAEQVEALRDLHAFLSDRWLDESGTPLGAAMRSLRDRLGGFLARVERDEDPAAAVARLQEVLLATFPDQIQRLRRALAPEPLSLESLPPELSRRMQTPDGRSRVQVFPAENLRDEEALERFTEAVTALAPDAAGIPINLAAFVHATRSSFVQALTSAIVLITLLLAALWRRPSDIALVLAPLFLAGLLTAGTMVLLDIGFNFANVVVLPLLFGIGVDSGIHLVHRSRQGVDAVPGGQGLMGTTTARAVFYSACTTMLSFGSLALSAHRGVASLGIVLSFGMLLTIVCNLVVLPALIEWRDERRDAGDGGSGS